MRYHYNRNEEIMKNAKMNVVGSDFYARTMLSKRRIQLANYTKPVPVAKATLKKLKSIDFWHTTDCLARKLIKN